MPSNGLARISRSWAAVRENLREDFAVSLRVVPPTLLMSNEWLDVVKLSPASPLPAHEPLIDLGSHQRHLR